MGRLGSGRCRECAAPFVIAVADRGAAFGPVPDLDLGYRGRRFRLVRRSIQPFAGAARGPVRRDQVSAPRAIQRSPASVVVRGVYSAATQPG